MPSTRMRTTKDGTIFYEISVSRGRGLARLTTRWYPPDGWSRKSIERELAKVAAAFEQKCKAGEVLTRKEVEEREHQARLEEARIQTLQQYSEQVFMPTLALRCSENTRTSYQGNFDHWIYPSLGAIKMPDIAPANITALLLHMQSEGKSHATIVKCYTILHSLFKMAYMSDVVSRNPMDKVERPKARKGETKPAAVKSYTAEEVRHIWNCLEEEPLKWRAFVRLPIDTGIRRGECCGLQWKDINFRENTITIAGNLCYTPQQGVYLDTPKNGKSRTIDVAAEVMRLLKLWRTEQSHKAISTFVFTQEGQPEPIHPQSPTHYFKSFAKRYGISDLHPHKLRHSFASVAITNGADIASVSEKLGHSDNAVTLRMYTHADQESIKRASNIFREALKNAK